MSKDTLRILARLGYGARGVVYAIIGVLAVLAAAGEGGAVVGPEGALSRVFGGPGGAVLLIAIAVGLAGYSLWRFIQAVADADHHGADARGIVIRAGLAISGFVHLGLALYSVRLALNAGASGGSGQGNEGIAAWLMQQPFGAYLVIAVGAVFIGTGIAQIARGLGGAYKKHFVAETRTLNRIAPICAFGLSARGVVLGIVGLLFIYAGITVDADQAGGLASALNWLKEQPYGTVLYFVIAVGLVAFGIYSLLEARFRRIDPRDPRHQMR